MSVHIFQPIQPAPQFRSYSDPDGQVRIDGDDVVRTVTPSRWASLSGLILGAVGTDLVDDGSLISTTVEMGAEPDVVVLHHPRLWFPTFPYEWIAAQLIDAGVATLDLQDRVLRAGFELKDASPYNVLFAGVRPKFVDVSSFEKIDARAYWIPYSQFLRSFVHPLIANRYWGTSLATIFLSEKNPDWGARLARKLPWTALLSPLILASISIPYRAGGRRKISTTPKDDLSDGAKALEAKRLAARFLRWQLRRAARHLANRDQQTVWGTYRSNHLQHYSAATMELRLQTVNRWCATLSAPRVLDIGCNDGFFSMDLAERGAHVIGIDGDDESLAIAYARAKKRSATFTPMLMDFARPTPRVGWENSEFPSFMDRAEKAFDVVLMMAVIHHLLVTSRLPLTNILAAIARISRDLVILEWVPIEDPRFQEIAANNAPLYAHLSRQFVEDAIQQEFRLVERVDLAEGRTLYLLKTL